MEKNENKKNIHLVEYLATLISMNPKATVDIIKKRRAKEEAEEQSRYKDNTYNSRDEHESTTFFDDIEQFGGAEAVKAIMNPEEYKEYQNQKKLQANLKNKTYQSQASDPQLSPEDAALVAELNKVAKEYETNIPKADQGDTIIFYE